MDSRIGRRAFAESLILLPFGLFLVRCSNNNKAGAAPDAGTGGAGTGGAGTGGASATGGAGTGGATATGGASATGGATGSGGSTGVLQNPPAAPPQASGGQIIYSSSMTSAHFHTFALDQTALTSPPAGGVSGDTSLVAQHVHTVTVTSDQLSAVGAGQTIQVMSGLSAGHTHVFTFTKIA